MNVKNIDVTIPDPPGSLVYGIYLESETTPQFNGWVDLEKNEWEEEEIFQTNDWEILSVEGENYEPLEDFDGSLEELQKIVEIIEANEDAFKHFADNYAVEINAENFNQYYYGKYEDRIEYGRQEIDNLYDLSENLQEYVDYERYVEDREWSREINTYYAESGGIHVFRG